MTCSIDVVELAHELAEIARTTVDTATGASLMEVVNRLLASAGLPAAGRGGGEVPTGWLSEPIYEAA